MIERRPVNDWNGKSNLPEYVKVNSRPNGGFDWLDRTTGNLPTKGSWKVSEKSFRLPLIVSLVAQVTLPCFTDEQGLAVPAKSGSVHMTITTSGPLISS